MEDILESSHSAEKIKILESLTDSNDGKIIQAIITRLGDKDTSVRGEAFSSLVLNENNILQFLMYGLQSDNKYIRGYTLLILANRKEFEAIPEIIKITKDEYSMVRSCALDALGYLGAQDASSTMCQCLTDPDIEVRKSAIHALISIDCPLSSKMIRNMPKCNDEELVKLIKRARTTVNY